MLLFTICLLFHKFVLSISTLANTHLLVTRIGPCDLELDTVVIVSEMVLIKNKLTTTLSGPFNISQDIADGWKVKATMQKCKDIRNLDTCDYLRSFIMVREGCVQSDDKEEEEMYSIFFKFVTPSISCPLKAGEYTIKDYPFFTEDGEKLSATESKISTSEFGYTFRVTAFSDELTVLCVDAYLKLQYVRKHTWTVTHNRTHVTTDNSTTQDDDDNNA